MVNGNLVTGQLAIHYSLFTIHYSLIGAPLISREQSFDRPDDTCAPLLQRLVIEAPVDLGHGEDRAHPDGHSLHLRPAGPLWLDAVAVDNPPRHDRGARAQGDHCSA